MTSIGRKIVVSWFFSALVGISIVPASGSSPEDKDTGLTPMESELESSGFLARFGLSFDDAQAPLEPLDEYLLAALRGNQALQNRWSDYRAAHESVSQVTSLPDPKVGYTEYLEPVETRVGPMERAFSLSQSFPWFGSLSLQGDVNQEKAEAVRAGFIQTALDVVTDVKIAYFEIGYLEQVIEVTEQHLQLMTQWEDVARARYSTGSGQYTDVIKAQVELGILSDRLAELRDQRRPLTATMNALLDREPASSVVFGRMPELPEQALELSELADRMKTQNPSLQLWDHRAQESLNTDRLVKKNGYPSFNLGMSYIQVGEARMDGVSDSGQDAWTASLGVTLPLWRGKYGAASRAAANRYEAAISGKRELSNHLDASLERAHFRYRDALRKVELYQLALLPKGRQSLEATRTSYEAGKSGFLDLVDTERVLLEFELSRSRAEFDVLIQQSVIENLVASPISGAGH